MRSFPAVKDPDEVKDYGFVWTDILDGDMIVTSTWTVQGGDITMGETYTVGDTTVIWLSGGTSKCEALLVNTIVTSSSPARTFQRSGRLIIDDL